jgi:hypothetical protein
MADGLVDLDSLIEFGGEFEFSTMIIAQDKKVR